MLLMTETNWVQIQQLSSKQHVGSFAAMLLPGMLRTCTSQRSWMNGLTRNCYFSSQPKRMQFLMIEEHMSQTKQQDDK